MANEITIAEVESNDETQIATGQITKANEYEIINQEVLDNAGVLLRAIVQHKNFIEKRRKEIKAPILQAGKQIDELFKAPIEACKKAEQIIKGKINTYLAEQERILREAEQKAEAERLAKQKELDVKLAEAQAEGDKKAIIETQAEKIEVELAPVLEAETPVKTDGIHQRKTWSAELTSLDELILAAANGNKMAYSFLSFNQSVANALAKQLKGAVKIPGIKFIETTGIVSR